MDYEAFWKQRWYRSLWQHPLWQQFQQAVGHRPKLLEVGEASALIVRHPLPKGFCWLEVPRGPLWKEGALEDLERLLNKMEAYSRSQKALFVRYSPFNRLNVPDARPAEHDYHPETNLVLDLMPSEDEILAQMKPKGRYNIRVAEKGGVTVSVSDDAEAFHELLQKTGERDRFGIHGEGYYRKMLDTLSNNAQLLLATHEGDVVAGGIFVYLDEWGIYYYGASDHAHRNLMAPYLVQWTAIREAKKRGCRQYDFLGIAPEGEEGHTWAGITQFKKKFGGTVVEYPKAQEVVLRPFWYWLYRLYKRLR